MAEHTGSKSTGGFYQPITNCHPVLKTSYVNKPFKEAEEKGSGNPFEEEEAIDDPNNPFFENKKTSEGEGKNNEKAASSQPAASTLLTPFSGIISSCFEPYLSIYIESQGCNSTDIYLGYLPSPTQIIFGVLRHV